MGNWNELLDEVKSAGSVYDVTRRKHLRKLSRITGRNTIAYYSGWLQKSDVPHLNVNDADKNGFMSVIHKMDRSKGLDLILHTPGGDTGSHHPCRSQAPRHSHLSVLPASRTRSKKRSSNSRFIARLAKYHVISGKYFRPHSAPLAGPHGNQTAVSYLDDGAKLHCAFL